MWKEVELVEFFLSGWEDEEQECLCTKHRINETAQISFSVLLKWRYDEEASSYTKVISNRDDQKVIGQNVVRFDTKLISNEELGHS